jgi:ammonia channel protein AmtB
MLCNRLSSTKTSAARALRPAIPQNHLRNTPLRPKAATAIVVGLVAITPAAGFISPMNAILLGRAEKTDEVEGLDVTQHGEEVPCDQWEPIDEWRLVSRMPRYTASDAAMTAVR